MSAIISKENELHFPDFTLVSASAGSGKTYALAFRILRILLSDKNGRNDLRNLLAMTFTKNAAAEMRQRVLKYLKQAAFGDPETLEKLRSMLPLEDDVLRRRARERVDEILDRYTDFQIQTIDSFLAHVFRASALELGFAPQSVVSTRDAAMIDEAFREFLESAMAGKETELLENLVRQMAEGQSVSAKFLWDPYEQLRKKTVDLFTHLLTLAQAPLPAEDGAKERESLRHEFLKAVESLNGAAEESGFEKAKWFSDMLDALHAGDVDPFMEKSIVRDPIKKGKSKAKNYEECCERCSGFVEQANDAARRWVELRCRLYYRPYLQTHALLVHNMETIQRRRGEISVGSVTKKLAEYISPDCVPELYLHLGEEIVHYCIDEFQDTSPIQWRSLYPLLDDTLARGGSFYVVGDTKQSIFSFRGADWRIMKHLEQENVFPSAPVWNKTLDTNYRSFEEIVEFNRKVFQEVLPAKEGPAVTSASGLSTYTQNVREKYKGKGYVERVVVPAEAPEGADRKAILDILADCRARRYSLRDIAVVTPKNDAVTQISGWLNESGIPFISYSSLDIRNRKTTGEFIGLLKFLDSPIDDLSFAAFLLGGIFQAALSGESPVPRVLPRADLDEFIRSTRNGVRSSGALYREFKQKFPDVWEKYFADLFRLTGYMPLYDLVVEIIKSFKIFENLPEEEGTIVRFLETVKEFENSGENSLKDFLTFAGDEEDDAPWTVDVPEDTNAVRVMTIHKAKGLGFRVAVVVLYDGRSKHENLFTEERDDGIVLLHIMVKEKEVSTKLDAVYTEQRNRETVDGLNQLYVALTRAEEEMYVVNILANKVDEPSAYFPASGSSPDRKTQAASVPHVEQPEAKILHLPETISFAGGSEEPLRWAERRRGDDLHAVLSRLEFLEENIEAQIHSLCEKYPDQNSPAAKDGAAASTLIKFLGNEAVRKFFERREGRSVRNEWECTMADGKLFRMDRVIVDPAEAVVVDFKTGGDKDAYTDQVRRYMKILKEIYPAKTVRGALAFIDRNSVREIE
jgi:ATP-dependent exoDNAse (exonuclease V) beta subunit